MNALELLLNVIDLELRALDRGLETESIECMLRLIPLRELLERLQPSIRAQIMGPEDHPSTAELRIIEWGCSDADDAPDAPPNAMTKRLLDAYRKLSGR